MTLAQTLALLPGAALAAALAIPLGIALLLRAWRSAEDSPPIGYHAADRALRAWRARQGTAAWRRQWQAGVDSARRARVAR